MTTNLQRITPNTKAVIIDLVTYSLIKGNRMNHPRARSMYPRSRLWIPVTERIKTIDSHAMVKSIMVSKVFAPEGWRGLFLASKLSHLTYPRMGTAPLGP